MSDDEHEVETDTQNGARRTSDKNWMIDDIYKNDRWLEPPYASLSFPIKDLMHEAETDSCLNSREALNLFRFFNEYGSRRFVKRFMYKVPDPLIRFLDQSLLEDKHRMEMILGIVETRKHTANRRGGHEIQVCAFFGINSRSKCLIAPPGFIMSTHERIEDAESCPIIFEEYIVLSAHKYPGIGWLKNIARKIENKEDISEDEIFTIFCLVQLLRTSQHKFSEKEMEGVSIFTGLSKNLLTYKGHFAVLGGKYAKGATAQVQSTLLSPNDYMVKAACAITDVYKYFAAYTHNYQPYATRRQGKRKAPADEEATTGGGFAENIHSAHLDFSWVKKDTFFDYTKRLLDEWNTWAAKKLPKTIEQLIAVKTKAGKDKVVVQGIREEYERTLQKLKAGGATDQEASTDAVMTCVKSEGNFVLKLATANRGEHFVEHPFMMWTRDSDEIFRNELVKILTQMIRASFTLAIKKAAMTHRSLNSEEMGERHTRFFKPHNPTRMLGDKIDSPSVVNTVKLENAMKGVLKEILSEPYGKDLALQAWIMHKDLRWVTDMLIEDEFIIESIRRMLHLPPGSTNGPSDLNIYFVPAIVNAMLLFFTRSMAIAVQKNGWDKLPDHIVTSKPCEEWPLPCKSGNLSVLIDKFGTIDEFMAEDAIQEAHRDDGKRAEMLELMNDSMIISRKAFMFLEKKHSSNVYTVYSVSKVINEANEFDLTVSKNMHAFSPYGIFETCDGKTIISQQLASPHEALKNHRIIYSIFAITIKIFSDIISSDACLELNAVPHIETAMAKCKGDKSKVNSEWRDLIELFDESDNKQTMNKNAITTINAALADISIATFFVVGKAIIDTDEISWNRLFPDNELLSRITREISAFPDPSSQMNAEGLLKGAYEKIGQTTRQLSINKKRSTIGLSIDNDILRGIVYVGGDRHE